MDQALANRPYEVAGAKKHQRRLQPHRPLRGFKATASSCDDSQTAHATHSTPSPPHSRQDHETPTSPQTPDNKLHHRHAKIFKSPLRQTPPIVAQHSAGYSSSSGHGTRCRPTSSPASRRCPSFCVAQSAITALTSTPTNGRPRPSSLNIRWRADRTAFRSRSLVRPGTLRTPTPTRSPRGGPATGRGPARSRLPPRRAEISTGFGFSPNASSTSSSFRTRSGDQVWNLLPRADWLLANRVRCAVNLLHWGSG